MKFTTVKIFGDWRTEPPINSLTEIILIQNYKAEVGRIIIDELKINNSHIEHPKNMSDLNIVATELIKQHNPKLFESPTSIIVLCPMELAEQCAWE
jgi:hypothetical protein